MNTKFFKPKFTNKVLEAKSVFEPEIAKKLIDISYYKAKAGNIKKIDYIKSEKRRLSTPRLPEITKFLETYKLLG